MANLTTTIQLLKRVGAFSAVLVIVIALVGLIIFRLTRKAQSPTVALSPPVINQNPDQKQPISFDFKKAQTPKIPKELPVFSAAPYAITDAAAKTLAATLGISGEPTLAKETTLDGKEYTWEQNDLRLVVSQTNLQWRNLGYRKGVLPRTGGFSLDQLQGKADSFVSKISILGEDRQIIPSKTRYLIISGNYLLDADSFENAQIIEFSYSKNLDSLPLVGNYPQTPYASIRVTKDGEVIYLVSRFFEGFSQGSSYPLKSTKQAFEEIKRGQGGVVLTQITNDKGQPLDVYSRPEAIQEAAITDIHLAYYLPEDTKEPIQPIFVAEGTFRKENEQGRIVIYLPAVKNLLKAKP